MMKKNLLLLFSLFAIIACNHNKSKTDANKNNPDFAKIIAQTTAGTIQVNDEIIIRFNNDMVEDQFVNQSIEEELFTFDPKIEGKTYWKTASTLVFEPSTPLSMRTEYNGTLNLKMLKSDFIPESLNTYPFNFETSGQAISSFKGDFHLKNSNSPKFFIFEGDLTFAEQVELSTIKEAISFQSNDQEFDLKIETGANNTIIKFQSEEIVRDNQTHHFKFIIDKESAGLEQNFEKSFQLTPINEMKVVSIKKITQSKNPKIRVEFSDELSSQQNIDGLITVKPMVEHKIQRMGNYLILSGKFRFGTEYKITTHKGIKSRWETKSDKTIEHSVKFPDIDPQLEFTSGGVYLPSSNDYKVQFNTCNLKRVHLEIKKVYDKSLIEFLNSEKVNSLNKRRTPFNNNYVNRTGVIVHNETFEIDNQKNKWLLSEIDLTKIIHDHQKGLYLIRINFNERDMLTTPDQSSDQFIEETGQIYKPIILSDIGLSCKKTGQNYQVWATDLNTTQALRDVKITLKRRYNYNKYELSAMTNSDGKATINPPSNCGNYFDYVIAEKGGEISALKFNEMEWNISGFDISGIDEQEVNTQAFVYTERGVYRPGDQINVSIIARHKNQKFPDNKTLTADLYNPQGKKMYSLTSKENKEGFYNFGFQTNEIDPTGNWRVSFQIGQRYFNQTIKIETIVPYRLKTKIETPEAILYTYDKTLSAAIDCKYLFGTPAKNNSAEVTLEISSLIKHFAQYENFSFTNPTINFNEKTETLYQGKLNDEGKKEISYQLPDFSHSPSAINLKINAKILEKGGRPNNQWKNITLNPYKYYLGIQNDANNVKSGTDLDLAVILTDTKGTAIANKIINYRIYRNEERWWWQYDKNRQLRFKSDTETILVKEGELQSKTTHALLHFLPIESGTYYVEVSDKEENGHSAGIFFNAYRYAYSSQSDNDAGALTLRSDKEHYNIGEKAHISFPAPPKGKILVSIEQSNKIISSYWVPANGFDKMNIDIPITKEMVPNVHLSVSVIQPQSQNTNDRPIRLFGILPITVIDEETQYDVEITTASQFRPDEPFEVNLQNSNHKKSQFTIAVVDEGLLDLTQFITPDPWKYIFRKRRLQVRTYDLFSQVISANMGDVFKTFAIGGDLDYRQSQLAPNKKERRFKPVSLFKGPIETDNNGKATVKFDMPNYVGSVRIMVVSATPNSYAHAKKTVPVKKELMVLPTLPRILGPGEQFQLPVSVFAMEDHLGDVKVEVKTTSPIQIEGSSRQILHFEQKEDKDCIFNLSTLKAAGSAKVTITVSNEKYSAKSEINLNVRPNSPRIFETKVSEIKPLENSTILIPDKGIEGSNNATLTITPFPGMNFSHRIKWLIHYPYGCIEQVTSAIFPQLYIKNFIRFPESRVEEIDRNINSGINKLRRFQLFNGAFSYWPGNSDKSNWGSLYAGHFLIEAKKQGYYVPDDLYNNWFQHTAQQARSNAGEKAYRSYRCYLLALAGQPVLSEMNQLLESELKDLTNTQKWQLSAAYFLAGQKDIAKKINKPLNQEVKDYTEFSGTFGSALRDQSIILEAQITMGMETQTTELTRSISDQLASSSWYSTQSLSYAIVALSKFMNSINNNIENPRIKGQVKLPDGEIVKFDDNKAVNINLVKDFGKDIVVSLDQESTFKKLYTMMNWNGVPLENKTGNVSSNLELTVEWTNEDGESIDPFSLTQGTSFWAHFNVKNISSQKQIEEIALLFILPSGWEVQNTRLQNEILPPAFSQLKLDYQEYMDIRDDRVMWFFDLNHWEPLNNEIDFLVKLNAVTVGEFQLPPIICEAMYNGSYKASIKGAKVIVKEAE